MTTAPAIAVVATQLAQTDRRALSQAWYSALHLTGRHAPAAAAASARRPGEPHLAGVRVPVPAADGAPAIATARRAARADATATRAGVERRDAPNEITRRIERAVERAVRAVPHRVAHTIAIDEGRITLLVRNDRGRTRIVALCSEPVRAVVERALARARFTLAARGHAVSAP